MYMHGCMCLKVLIEVKGVGSPRSELQMCELPDLGAGD